MGVLTKIKAAWKAASTAEKINVVLDLICGVGCGILTYDVEQKVLPGHNRLEKVCISTVTTGLGLAAATTASKAIMDNYGNLAADIIDRRKAKAKEKTEENADE